MAAETRFASVLFASFLLWLPALDAFLGGDLDAASVGVRFTGAVAVVWGGMSLVTTIAAGYRVESPLATDSVRRTPTCRSDDRSASPVQGSGPPPDEPLSAPASSRSDE